MVKAVKKAQDQTHFGSGGAVLDAQNLMKITKTRIKKKSSKNNESNLSKQKKVDEKTNSMAIDKKVEETKEDETIIQIDDKKVEETKKDEAIIQNNDIPNEMLNDVHSIKSFGEENKLSTPKNKVAMNIQSIQTPSWLPKGMSTSGGAVLERSRVGATLTFGSSAQIQIPRKRRIQSRGRNDDFQNIKGWTPVPHPPPETQSQFHSNGSRRSRFDSWDSIGTDGGGNSTMMAVNGSLHIRSGTASTTATTCSRGTFSRSNGGSVNNRSSKSVGTKNHVFKRKYTRKVANQSGIGLMIGGKYNGSRGGFTK
jgi:hypothetical protein